VGDEKRVAKGYRYQFLYVLIQCMHDCTRNDFRLICFVELAEKKLTCCGGFAVMKGKKKYI
jgi:hypothetical protein